MKVNKVLIIDLIYAAIEKINVQNFFIKKSYLLIKNKYLTNIEGYCKML